MTRSTLIVTAAALAALPLTAACTDGGSSSGGKVASADSATSAVPIAKVTGAPQSCIPIAQIRESRIRDDSTIDFVGTGRNQAWRVSLPSPCPSLKSENRFSYATSLTQLCSTDIIYVLYDYGGANRLQRGAGCGLSQFTPISLAK